MYLESTLKCGQAFRWNKIAQNTFRGAYRERLWTLKQEDDRIEYSVIHAKDQALPTDNSHDLLWDYLNLNVDLGTLYTQWCSKDSHFLEIASTFPGIRMLRQDPFENLLCFICSTNNNIGRITKMVNALCTAYGQHIATVEDVAYHDFPKLESLLHDGLEQELRALGFGYRAKFIAHTTRALALLPPTYLHDLRSVPYEEAHTALMGFMGVGAKVADCVALMSLDKTQAVPVDTHVLQIAHRDYHLRTKDPMKIKQFFMDLWGDYAGWAHSILFTADLRSFKDVATILKTEIVLPAEVTAEVPIKLEATAVGVEGRSEGPIKPEETAIEVEAKSEDTITLKSEILDTLVDQPLQAIAKRPSTISVPGTRRKRTRT